MDDLPSPDFRSAARCERTARESTSDAERSSSAFARNSERKREKLSRSWR